MRPRSAVGSLSLLRQGLSIEIHYGTRSLEALLSVAEAVEDAVYATGSLRRIPGGLALALDNPPLRVGAFSAVRVLVDRNAVPPAQVRLRRGPGAAWRTASDVTADSPYRWGPGEPTEFELETSAALTGEPVCVRIELVSIAVPPLVWCEIREVPAPEDAGR